jgi:rhodanese-related sulfurtransferase
MMHKAHHSLVVLAVNVAILSCASYGFEKDALIFKPSPHCGLYSVYAAARYCGTQVRFVDLVKPEYVGRAKGSSLNELRRCAEDIGMHAQAVRNIDSRFLRQVRSPVVLHVKKDYASRDYSHYVLFMGTENGKAMILDASRMMTMSFGDLLPLMDGVALIVSQESIPTGRLIWSTKGRMIAWTVVAFVLVNAVRAVLNKDRCRKGLNFLLDPAGSYIAQAGIVVAMSLAASFLFHFCAEGGYLSSTKYTDAIIASHRHTFLPKIGKSKVKALLKEGAVVIDARYYEDFKKGSIDGAINLPIDANDTANKAVLGGVDRDRKIVVYCQSPGCKFADSTALWLKENNYGNVWVYRGGWTDWIR